MKVVVRDHQQFQADADRAQEQLLREHQYQLEAVRTENERREKLNASEAARRKTVLARIKKVAASALGWVDVPEGMTYDLIPEPERPEPLDHVVATYTAERLPRDYESDDEEHFKMVGPIRVLRGEWILTNDETGQIHSVTNDDFERMFVQA